VIRAVYIERATIIRTRRARRYSDRPRRAVIITRRVDAPTPRISAIDPQYPVYGTPTTQSVRDNFAAAKSEIEALQGGKLDLTGGTMSGAIGLAVGQILDGGSF